MLRPIETGQVLHRAMLGLPPKYHSRLKQGGRTLAILQGDTQQEADDRAQRLADVLIPDGTGVIEQA
ncbi:hypothetical protein EGJ08_11170 [Stutzerimonas stutzeri]|nr:hypothetical protein EGJ08_11170 [Stutzerimonas stutzeri]RTM23575.1 hypothetical protein EKN22_09820 [Stutzerimonas stutzeri]